MRFYSQCSTNALQISVSVYCRYNLYKECIELYEIILAYGYSPDVVMYNNAVRAASFARPWNYTLYLLEQARLQTQKPSPVLLWSQLPAIINTAMTNLKYFKLRRDDVVMNRANDLLDWMLAKSLTPTAQTLDILLAVACKHGNSWDCSNVLKLMQQHSLLPTLFTFNTLLDRSASAGNAPQCDEIVQAIQAMGLKADGITYNTLLKLCVKTQDQQRAQQV